MADSQMFLVSLVRWLFEDNCSIRRFPSNDPCLWLAQPRKICWVYFTRQPSRIIEAPGALDLCSADAHFLVHLLYQVVDTRPLRSSLLQMSLAWTARSIVPQGFSFRVRQHEVLMICLVISMAQ